MTHTSYRAIVPFEFHSLQIRELTPPGVKSASVAEISVPVGASHARARSLQCDKLYICLTGSVAFRLDDHDCRLSPGDVLGIPRTHWFAYANEGPADARLLLVHVPPFDLSAEELA